MAENIILSSLNNSMINIQKNEILNLNERSQEYGLILTPDDVENIVKSRNHTLNSYGRIDLNMDVTKEIMEILYKSQFTDKDDYVEMINDLVEIFYFLKNETFDEISDKEIIEIIGEFYEETRGRIDNIQDKAEKFSIDYKYNMGNI